MTSIDQQKAALRDELLKRRAALSAEQRRLADAFIAQAVIESPLFQNAGAIFSYVSFGEEVDTEALIEAALTQGKRVAVPRCVPKTRLMEWHYVRDRGELKPGAFGILEPEPNPATLAHPVEQAMGARAEEAAASELTGAMLALVPGLAFDRRGFRIGYGGGYYDRFLAQFSGRAMGLVRAPFLVESLGALGVVDCSDVPVNCIATEGGVLL